MAPSDTKRTSGCFSTSKKSAERRWLSRSLFSVSMLARVNRQRDRERRLHVERAVIAPEVNLDGRQIPQGPVRK